MKHFPLLIFVALFVPVFAISQDTLSYPTDIIYDSQNEEYYVSNWADEDYPGYILKLNAAGEVTENFYPGLDLPGGICQVGDTLYVLNNKDLYGGNQPSYLLGIDMNTGQKIVDVEIGTGGIYVDMVTTDNKGNLYITDSENLKIYKYNIQSQTFEDFVTNINKPIGICYNEIDDQIMFTISKSNISYVAAISPEGGNFTTMFYHTGWLEGIVMNSNGDYYLSSWTGSGGNWGSEPVYKASHALDWKFLLNNNNNRPFGMCLGKDNHLAVCNWGSHVINFIDLTLFGTNELQPLSSFKIYPNPSEGNVQIDLSGFEASNLDLSVYDISGKEVFNKKIVDRNMNGKENLDLDFLETGTYIVTVLNDNTVYHQKLIVY
ncbi:MAG: T9SS type A sorting domain-containing protein [Chlorobi bacterium]|nr:T9SS type A sorting domain-containing protein [Chlorobiota bacterium]